MEASGPTGPSTDFTRIALHPIADVYSEIAAANALAPALITQYAIDGGS